MLEQLYEWAATRPSVLVVPGRWQDALFSLPTFDRVFFDDYPLDADSAAEAPPGWSRWHEFLDALFSGQSVCLFFRSAVCELLQFGKRKKRCAIRNRSGAHAATVVLSYKTHS